MYNLYKITNKINGKLYFGITGNPSRRAYEHFYKKSGTFSIVRLAVAKHGVENFKFEVVVVGSQEYISELEKKAILHYKTTEYGYNIRAGGCPEKGSTVKHRSDDVPVLAFGFWFPNNRTAITTLGINPKTFYSQRREGTLHLEGKPLKTKKRNKRGSPEDLLQRSLSMQGKNAGEANGMYGKPSPRRKHFTKEK